MEGDDDYEELEEEVEDCDPPCINGACSDTECYCQQGYMGKDCSISMIYYDKY